MNIFDTMTALFSGERVSHTDIFILVGMMLALLIRLKSPRDDLSNMIYAKILIFVIIGIILS